MKLARRQLGPVAWGEWFTALLDRKGVGRGSGSRNDQNGTSATFAEVAGKQNVSERTAYNRMELAELLADYPTLKEWVDGSQKFSQDMAKENCSLASRSIPGGGLGSPELQGSRRG